jgi:PGF-CTERM protein
MKKGIATIGMIAILIVSAFALAIPVSAAPTADSFGVTDAAGYSGTVVSVPVNITNAQSGPIIALKFDIHYDTSVITVSGVQQGDLIPSWDPPLYNNFAWGSRVIANYNGFTGEIPNGATGSVVILNFNVVGAAGSTSNMNLTDIQLSDTAYNVGTAPASDGTFTVNEAPPATTGDVLINEIMYNPSAAQGADTDMEWLELYNNDSQRINLSDWLIDDTIITTDVVLDPDSYAVLARNKTAFETYYGGACTCSIIEATFSLTNTGDTIVLKDATGTEIDTVTYLAAWGANGNGYTLELNATGGWEESQAEGGTPCQPNSVLTPPVDTLPPVTTPVVVPAPNAAGWNNVVPVNVTFTRVDQGGSGVNYTRYSTTSGEGPWTTIVEEDPFNGTTFNVTIDTEGETTIWYYSVDLNETPNTEAVKNMTVKIDVTPPGTVTGLNETDASWMWIQWNWTNPVDPGSSGFDYVEVYIDDIFKENVVTGEYKAEGLVPNTTYEIETRAVDVAGNKGEWQNDTATTIADEVDPTVTVTSPDGGEVWTVGTQQEITWTADDNVGVTAIDIYYKNGTDVLYIEIATGETNDGTYTWTIPDDQSTNCSVKVVAHDAAGNTGEDASNAVFTIAVDEEDPIVTVTAPNGGESWTEGETRTITWTADDNVGVTTVDIAYSTDGGATYPNTIATSEANDGTYTWTVPSDYSKTCRVKVVAHDAAGNTGEDASNANFEIKKKYVPVGGGSGGPALDTDGDGYSDIVEWLQGSDPNDPCDPDPNSELCSPTPKVTPTAAPTAKPTAAPTAPPAAATPPPAAATPTPTPEEPGFGAVFAIAGLLAVAYLVLRRKQE